MDNRKIESKDLLSALSERRYSITPSCLNCTPKQRCCLSRAAWFQEIRTLRNVGRQVTLFRQGEPADKIYALRKGWVQTTHLMPNGKAITDLYGPGSLFGIEAASAQSEYPYSAVAIEECEFEEADAAEFLTRLQGDPHLAIDVLRYVSRNMQRLLSLFYASASKVRSADRLVRMLEEISLNCSTVVDGGVRINLPLTVQVLAEHIGCSRQWVSKMLSDLERKGTLQRRGTNITFSPDTIGKHRTFLKS